MRSDALAVCAYVVATIDQGARDRDVHDARIRERGFQVFLLVWG